MNYKNLLESLTEFFNNNNINYGIIGAFALFSYGYVRATRDIDFVIKSENKKKVIKFLESLGFKTEFSSNAFSNHVHPIGTVRIDIMYVDNATADSIFKSVEKRLVLNDLEIQVVSIEHLIAMKLFAIQNNPDRKYKDLADIKELLKHTEFDKKKILEYFNKYGLGEYYYEITGEKK